MWREERRKGIKKGGKTFGEKSFIDICFVSVSDLSPSSAAVIYKDSQSVVSSLGEYQAGQWREHDICDSNLVG